MSYFLNLFFLIPTPLLQHLSLFVLLHLLILTLMFPRPTLMFPSHSNLLLYLHLHILFHSPPLNHLLLFHLEDPPEIITLLLISPTIFIPPSTQQHLILLHKPQYYQQAASNPAWKLVMTKEFEALATNHTYDFIYLPLHKKAITCKWIYKIKQRSDSRIERYKARLVIIGDA